MTDLVNRKYRIIDKIGGGSFGAVYKGQHVRTNEFVAIKVEPIEGGIHLLKNESIIYQYLFNYILFYMYNKHIPSRPPVNSAFVLQQRVTCRT